MRGQQNIKNIIRKTEHQHLHEFVCSTVKAQHLMSDNQAKSSLLYQPKKTKRLLRTVTDTFHIKSSYLTVQLKKNQTEGTSRPSPWTIKLIFNFKNKQINLEHYPFQSYKEGSKLREKNTRQIILMAKTQPVTQAHFCRFQNIFFKYFLPLFKTSHNGGKKLLRSDEQKHGLQNTRRLPESMPHHTPSAIVTVSAISKLPAHIPSNRNFCYKKKKRRTACSC